MENRNESKIAHIFVIGLILGAALLYFPPYKWAWVGDDYVQFGYVLEYLKRPLSAIQLLNPYALPWYYRPMQNWWFLGNRSAFGLNPAVFYWQMVLWHSLVTALVYRVLRQFGVRAYSAVLATALFAIHGHYVDVVGWNSSVAIVMAAVFSLSSLSAYKGFLSAKRAKSAKKNRYLAVSFLFFVLALVTHEEAVLLPVFLVVLMLMEDRRDKAEGKGWQVSKAQVLMLGGMLILTGTLVIIQFTRPNLTINISQTPTTHWWELVSPTQIGQFVKDISLRYTLTLNWSLTQGATPLLLAIAVLMLLSAWFLISNWTVRLGLIWVALHLGLIFATLWQSKPELLAGRHFYQASFGLVLAIGASVDQLREVESPKMRMGNRRVSLVMAGIVGVIVGTLIGHVSATQTTQQKWLERAETDQSVRKQMQMLLPELNEATRVFVNRFSITPAFFRSVTELWYELAEPIPQPTGSFTHLQNHGRATEDFYVFDYEDGKLYNLMPELQDAAETLFIWSQEARLDMVAEDGQIIEVDTNRGEYDFAALADGERRRFAVSLAPVEVVNGWLSLAYVIPEVPADSTLQLSIRTDAASGASARVRLDPAPGDAIILFDDTVTSKWLEISEPMGEFVGQTVVVRLETAVPPGGTVYWGNPRFVVGH